MKGKIILTHLIGSHIIQSPLEALLWRILNKSLLESIMAMIYNAMRYHKVAIRPLELNF